MEEVNSRRRMVQLKHATAKHSVTLVIWPPSGESRANLIVQLQGLPDSHSSLSLGVLFLPSFLLNFSVGPFRSFCAQLLANAQAAAAAENTKVSFVCLIFFSNFSIGIESRTHFGHMDGPVRIAETSLC